MRRIIVGCITAIALSGCGSGFETERDELTYLKSLPSLTARQSNRRKAILSELIDRQTKRARDLHDEKRYKDARQVTLGLLRDIGEIEELRAQRKNLESMAESYGHDAAADIRQRESDLDTQTNYSDVEARLTATGDNKAALEAHQRNAQRGTGDWAKKAGKRAAELWEKVPADQR
jgi:hypothetical protein